MSLTYGRDGKPGGNGPDADISNATTRSEISRRRAGAAMRSKGFTLVEILVVVVIMAVVISLTVLSVNATGRDSQLDEESRRIEGLGRACCTNAPCSKAAISVCASSRPPMSSWMYDTPHRSLDAFRSGA